MRKCVLQTARPLCSRFASTHWRHVEQNTPIPQRDSRVFPAPKGADVARMDIDLIRKVLIAHLTDASLITVDNFDEETRSGAVIRFKDDRYKLLGTPVADSYYNKIYVVSQEGFIQYREHFRNILKKKDNSFRTVLTGGRGSGKTMTLYSLLLSYLDAYKAEETRSSVIVPALHLTRCFQDTANTTLNRAEGQMDFPEFNKEFLQFLLACDALNGDQLAGVQLSEDERWNTQLFSFKGDSLADVARVGVSNVLVAGDVIRVILDNLASQKIFTTVLIDNANLLCEIHSSMLENFRSPDIENWWEHPQPDAGNIILLRNLKEFAASDFMGRLVMTVDSRNPITDQLLTATNTPAKAQSTIPNTPTHKEFKNYLSMMQNLRFITRAINDNELAEFSCLTGRSYLDTNKYMSVL